MCMCMCSGGVYAAGVGVGVGAVGDVTHGPTGPQLAGQTGEAPGAPQVNCGWTCWCQFGSLPVMS